MSGEDLERRVFELRAPEPDSRILAGPAMPYGTEARIGPLRERFERGAFGDASALDVTLNVMHDRTRLLARTGGGGVELLDGPDALEIRATLLETREADDVLRLVRARVLRGLSIEFRAIRERAVAGVRVVESAVLRGVAVVDRPAYEGAVVAVRWRDGADARTVATSIRRRRWY